MKWPWVHRARLDALEKTVRDAEGVANRLLVERDLAERRLIAERVRADKLVGELLRMKREGYVPQPEPPGEIEDAGFPEVVESAIADRAFNPAMERNLRRVAAQLLREKKPEEVVARLILDGEPLDEVEDEEAPGPAGALTDG